MWIGRTPLKTEKKDETDPDALLMLQCQRGDEKSYELLFHKYFKYVLNLSRRFFDNVAQAEEMVQEVFTQVYLAKDTYKATAKFKTWLYRITINKCLNEVRKGSYQVSVESIDEELEDEDGRRFNKELVDHSEMTPLEGLEKAELEKMFKEALESLTEQQQICFNLSRYANLSYAEIAQITHTTENAVKSLIHRANISLKKYLEAYLQDESRRKKP